MAIHTVHDLNQEPAFATVARVCAWRVTLGGVSLLGLLAAVGQSIEHRAALGDALSSAWSFMLWLFSLGGHFWASVAVGYVSLGLLAWALCVQYYLPKKEAKGVASLTDRVGALAGLMWFLANLAMQSTYTHYSTLTVYEKIGVFIMHGPYAAIPFILLGSIVCGLMLACPQELDG